MPVVRLLAAWVYVAAIAGCASSMIETSLGDADNLPDAYGIVAVQVVSNVHRLSPELENWTAVFAVDLSDREKRFRLAGLDTGLLGSRVFVGALPPGHYAIYNLHSYLSLGDRYMWINAPVPPLLGSFRVADRHLTHLGTIVYQPLAVEDRTNPGGGIPYVVSRLDDLQNLDAFVTKAYPHARARMVDDIQLSWDDDASDAVREQLSQRIREVGFGSRVVRLADGTFAVGGKLGRIYWRNGAGLWRHSDSGYTNEIAAVASLDQGVAIAGERGLVLVAPRLEGPWIEVAGPGADEAVEWLQAFDDGSLAALTRSDGTWRLYRVSGDFSQWRVLREVEFVRGVLGRGGEEAHAIMGREGKVVLFTDGKRIEYDPATDAVEETSSHTIHRLAQMADGTLVAIPGHWWSGTGAPVFSRDEGRSWRKFKLHVARESWDTPTSNLPFLLPGGREAVVSRKMYRPPLSKRLLPTEERFLRLSAGGEDVESWGAILDPACLQGLPQVSSGDTLYMLCDDGRIMRSDDAGALWKVDRDVNLREVELPDELMGLGTQT